MPFLIVYTGNSSTMEVTPAGTDRFRAGDLFKKVSSEVLSAAGDEVALIEAHPDGTFATIVDSKYFSG